MSSPARLFTVVVVTAIVTAGATLLLTHSASAQTRRVAICLDSNHGTEPAVDRAVRFVNMNLDLGKTSFVSTGSVLCAW